MNRIRTDYAETRGGRVNEWESILGRLDAVGAEINRALGWVTSIEEPGSEVGIACALKVFVSVQTASNIPAAK